MLIIPTQVEDHLQNWAVVRATVEPAFQSCQPIGFPMHGAEREGNILGSAAEGGGGRRPFA